MRVLPDFQRNSRRPGLLATSSLLLLFAAQTLAQSGRRAPKPTQTPVTNPETDKQPATPNSRDLTRQTSLLVAQQPSSKRLPSRSEERRVGKECRVRWDE